ncbi:MAG: hypothetical protein COU67_02130 [Candidatus Pacebacteria bacterium CG10_big_fil_rev_8_21_14_0_10_44_54]|nr:MAG: hypothetical protein COU67_02130 [Candidatus Pacebacteria bacterium CG10_big_fil_rev_8_21_14_0_10_44_54]
MKHKKTAGFTFIELLVSATIIIVLSVIGMVSFAKAGKSARDARRKADLAMVQQAMVQYKVNEGGLYYVPAGADGKAKFVNLVNELKNEGYLSSPVPADPKNDATYYYTYSGDTVSFTVSAALPENGGTITFSNP